MPEIGRPETSSAFNNIKMETARLSGANGNAGKMSEADIIRKATGRKEDKFFKDASKHNVMGKDEFMKLLTQQLQNQDPMNPMDQSKFASELAQFAQLEQMGNVKTSMDKMAENSVNEKKSIAASFLGKEIVSKGASINLKEEGDNEDVYFNLPADAKEVHVRIMDKNNNIVGQITHEGPMSRGSQSLTWNGKMLDGYGAKPGQYSVQIVAFDKESQKMDVETKSSGTVKSVSFDNGEMVFSTEDGKKVFMRDVETFQVPKEGARQAAAPRMRPEIQQIYQRMQENLPAETRPRAEAPSTVAPAAADPVVESESNRAIMEKYGL